MAASLSAADWSVRRLRAAGAPAEADEPRPGAGISDDGVPPYCEVDWTPAARSVRIARFSSPLATSAATVPAAGSTAAGLGSIARSAPWPSTTSKRSPPGSFPLPLMRSCTPVEEPETLASVPGRPLPASSSAPRTYQLDHAPPSRVRISTVAPAGRELPRFQVTPATWNEPAARGFET